MSGIGIDACNNSLDVTVFQGETGQFTNPSGGHQKRVDWLGTLSVRQVVLEATGGRRAGSAKCLAARRTGGGARQCAKRLQGNVNQLLRSVARLDKRIAGQLKTLLIKQPHVAAVKTLNGEGKAAIVAVMRKMRVILHARVRAERAAMRPAWAHSAAIILRKSVPANGRHLADGRARRKPIGGRGSRP